MDKPGRKGLSQRCMSPQILTIRSGPSIDSEVPRCGRDLGGRRGKECLLVGWWKHPHQWGGTAVSTLKANITPHLDQAAWRVDFVVCGSYLNKAAINRRMWQQRYRIWGSLTTWEMRIVWERVAIGLLVLAAPMWGLREKTRRKKAATPLFEVAFNNICQHYMCICVLAGQSLFQELPLRMTLHDTECKHMELLTVLLIHIILTVTCMSVCQRQVQQIVVPT